MGIFRCYVSLLEVSHFDFKRFITCGSENRNRTPGGLPTCSFTSTTMTSTTTSRSTQTISMTTVSQLHCSFSPMSQLNMDFADHADPDMCHLDLFWLCLSSEVWHMGHDPTSIIIFTIFHSNLEWLLPRCTVGLKRLKLQPRNSLESIGMQRSPRIHPYWNKSLTVGYKSIV